MKTFDLRGHTPQEILNSNIPKDTESVILANNSLEDLPETFFLAKKQVYEIDLSRNKLHSTQFLQCFRCINILDLRFNNLQISDLYFLRFSTIFHIKLYGNPFQSDPNYNPLIIPAIISRAWIIDGTFVSDYIRKMATDLRNSKNFFESVRPVKYSERSLEMTVAEKSIFDKVSTIDFKTPPPIQFMCKNMSALYQATDFNQNERLRYLSEKYDVSVKPGRFIDHFGILLGLLCAQWLGEAIEIIPRCFCGDYWFDVSQTMQEYENWQHLLVIVKIMNIIKFETPQQQDLFDSLQIKRYLASGRPPFPGSTPRLILTAFLARAVSNSPVQLTQCDDLKIYFKFRKNCGFTTHENSIESIHHEFFCTFSIPNGPIPEEGDKVSIAHPLSGEWTEGTTISVNNGRIFVQLGDLISQMPIMALFWDGRGLWKEGTITKRVDENFNKQFEVQHNTFEVPEMNDTKVAPSSRTTYLDIGREALRKSKFIDRSFKKNVTFRGIVDPPFKRPNTARRKRDPAITSPHQIVDDVVNVVKGTEISEGRYLRKFLVRFVNELTKKANYVWVSEADIPKCDVDRLIQIYMKHLGN